MFVKSFTNFFCKFLWTLGWISLVLTCRWRPVHVDITRAWTFTVDIDIKGWIRCLLSTKTYLFTQPKNIRTQTQNDVTQHTTTLWGPGIHSEREEQQPVPEYRIDYDAPRVAHRSCSALRRLPARARPDLLASSVWRRSAHRSDWQ